MDIRDIGMVIRKARQLQGISQERLAEHGKVSKQNNGFDPRIGRGTCRGTAGIGKTGRISRPVFP